MNRVKDDDEDTMSTDVTQSDSLSFSRHWFEKEFHFISPSMLESLLLSLIDRYLSRYLLEINAEQFSADLLSRREIVIENLSLHCPNINADLRFPLEFLSIVVGRVQCSFFALRLEHLHVRLRQNLLLRRQEETETNNGRFLLSMLDKVQLEIVDLQVTHVNENPSFLLRFHVDRIEMGEGLARVTHPSLHLDDRTLLYPSTTMEIHLQHAQLQCFVNRLELQINLEQILLLLQFFRSIRHRSSRPTAILRCPSSSSWYQTSSDWLKSRLVDWWTTPREDRIFQFTVNIQSINLRIESLFPLDLFNLVISRDSMRLDGISLGDFLSSVKQDRPILELTIEEIIHLRSSSSQFQLSKALPITAITEFIKQIPKIEGTTGEKTLNIDAEFNQMKVNINNREETISVGFSQLTWNNDVPTEQTEEEEFSTPRGSPVPMSEDVEQSIRFRLKDFQVECLRDEHRRSLVDRCELSVDVQCPSMKMEIVLPQLRIDLDRFDPRRNLLQRLIPLLRLPPFPFEFHLVDLVLILPNRLRINVHQLRLSSVEELRGTIESVLLSHSLDVVVHSVHFSTPNFFDCRLGFEGMETIVSSGSTKKRRCSAREMFMEKTQLDLQWNQNQIEVHLPSMTIRLNSNLLESVQLESLAGIDVELRLSNSVASFRSPSLIHFHCSSLDLIENREEKVRSLIVSFPNAIPSNVVEVDLLQFTDWIIHLRSLRFLLSLDWLERLSRPLQSRSSRSLNVELHLHAVQLLIDLRSDALLLPLTMKMIYQGAIEGVLDDVGLSLCQIDDPEGSLRPLIDPPLRLQFNLLDELEMKISPIHVDLSSSIIDRLLPLFRSIPVGQHRSFKGQFQCQDVSVSISEDFLPLLKMNLRSLRLGLDESLEMRCGFDVFYWNRSLSGLEPLVEPCSVSLTIDRSPSSLLVSVHSTERFNINLSESFFDLCRTFPRQWSKDLLRVDCYSLWNLLGMEVRLTDAMDEGEEGQWTVKDGERISFKPRGKKIGLSFAQWKCSSSISLDRQGHFLRRAQSTTGREEVIIRIEIQRTKLVTIRSSREIRNDLNTPVDVRWKNEEEEERRLEPGESFSLPIQSTKSFAEIEVRPSDFDLSYSSRLGSSLHSCSMSVDVESLFFVHLHSPDEKHLSIECPLIFVNLLPCSLTVESSSSRERVSLDPHQSWLEHTWNVLHPMEIRLSRGDYRMKTFLRLGECRDVSLVDPFARELFLKIDFVSRREHRWKIFISSPFVVFNRTGQTFVINDDQHQLNEEPFLADSKKETIRLKVTDPHGQWSQPLTSQSIGIFQRQLTSQDKERSTIDVVIDIREAKKGMKVIFVNNRYLVSNHSSFDLSIVEKDSILSVPRQSTCPFHRSSSVQIQLFNSTDRSGSFSIDDEERAFDLNIRLNENQLSILHIELIEEKGSFFLLITDCDQHRSPPYRLRNRSDLPVEFYQTSVPHRRRILRGRETIAYALDDPRGKASITCRIDGGSRLTLDLRPDGEERSLFYPNWICLSLGEDLVIDYLSQRLIVAKRDDQRASQWWLINDEGLLIHCHSSPRLRWSTKTLSSQQLTNAFVLSSSFDQLSIERFDPDRRDTQRWRFDDRGYLRLIASPMCLQVFGEFQATSDVILVFHPECESVLPDATLNVFPRQRYEGSGCLTVRVKCGESTSDLLLLEIDHADYSRPSVESSLVSELNVHLEVGLGLSFIGRRCEELLYAELDDLRLVFTEHSWDLAVKSVQVWNQLLNARRPSFVSIPRGLTWKLVGESLRKISSFQLDVDLMEIQLDENLLEKFIELKHPSGSSDDQTVDNVHQRSLSLVKSRGMTFDRVSLSKFEMTLSVSCLSTPRRRRSFRLVPFENARLSFSALEHRDLSISWKQFLDVLSRHYLSQSKRQALKILGSADVLGNPLGLLVDVAEGWTSCVEQRSVAGLMKNVVDGLRNSTSKMSNELGRLAVTTMDEQKTPKFFKQWTRSLLAPTVGLGESKRRLPRSPGNLFGLIEVYSMDNARGHSVFQQRFNQEESKTERFLLRSSLSSTLDGILTTERVLLYHPISFDVVSTHSLDQSLSIPGLDENCLFAREIERAIEIFREEKFISPEDED